MKLYITGAPGSGKTFLSKRLSQNLSVNYYCLDDIVWDNSKGKINNKFPEEIRDTFVRRILSEPEWIIEGIYFQQWLIPIFEQADYVIILTPPPWLRLLRLISRHLFERYDFYQHRDNIKLFYSNVLWGLRYDNGPFHDLSRTLEKIRIPVIIYRRKNTDNLYHKLVNQFSGTDSSTGPDLVTRIKRHISNIFRRGKHDLSTSESVRDSGSPTSDRLLVHHKNPNAILRFINNVYFLMNHPRSIFRKKILYLLTPPSWIRNTGDQAQAIAILIWLRKFWPKHEIIELNQSESAYFLKALRLLVRQSDLIFLHSGGNMGDRYMGIERPRRDIIRVFSKNKIISLPQTICFSDTEQGRVEQKISADIYNAHPDLSIICRDRFSARTAVSMFKQAKLFCIPDFVLSLPKFNGKINENKPPIIICRRLDKESVFNDASWHALAENLPYTSTFYDTRFEEPIQPAQREARLEETLRTISSHRIVITDRFHAIVFAILCKRPCIALPTIDHKVIASRYWFHGVLYAETMGDVPALVQKGLSYHVRDEENWNRNYFDHLPEQLGLKVFSRKPITTQYAEIPVINHLIPVEPYQKASQFRIGDNTLFFDGDAASDDEWCFVRVSEDMGNWRNVIVKMDVCRHTEFREFAFNFRYRDFNNRYRYRFENGRLYFDKKWRGRWHNHLASIPFLLKVGHHYSLRIEVYDTHFSCYVGDHLIMENSDSDITEGSFSIVGWETDTITPIKASIHNILIQSQDLI